MKKTNFASKIRVLLVKIQLLLNPSFRNSVILEDGYQQIVSLNELELLRIFVNNVVKRLQNQISSVGIADSPEIILRKGTSNFLVQKTFISIFSSDYLCRSFILARVSNSPLWFPLSREMRQEAKRLEISISTLICCVLWFTFKIRRVIGTLLRELFTHFTVLQFSSGNKISLNVLDLTFKKADQEKIPVLISFADWFVKMPTDLKERFWHSQISSVEFSKIDINSYKTNEIKQEKVLRIFLSFSTIIIELIPFCFLRKILHEIIAKLFSNKIHDVVSKYKNSNSIFLVPSNSGISRPVWTYLYQFSGSEFLYIQLSHAADPNPFEGELLDFEALNTWGNTYSSKNITRSNLNVSQKSNLNGWTRIPEWSLQTTLPYTIEIGAENYISVFDIEPQKNWYGMSTLNEIGYNKVDVVSRFLQTILEEASKKNFVLLHKPKRNIGGARLVEYTKLLSALIEEYPSNYILVPADVSPVQIISKSKGAISMPCTSTAIIAQDIGSPTVFFDVTSLINPSDEAAVGVQILQDRQQLSSWITSLN